MASPRRRASLALGALVLAAGLGVGSGTAGAAPADLVGTFTIAPGACSGNSASGSYFRMIQPTGTQTGPFVENTDSRCGNKSYTLFVPGTEGGLRTDGYQPAPTPGFDADGDSLATRIIQPVKFFGRDFSLSTNATDLQVGQAVPVPVIRADGTKLSGDLTSFNATWNREAFNQGAPKPGGGLPGNTKAVTGTYDAATGRYSLTWSSQIVGGPFDNFTGQWHLEGTFRPAAAGATTGSPAATTPTAAGATPTTVAGTPTPAVGDAAGPSTTASPSAGDDDVEQAADLTTVTDNGFQAPAGVVILVALLGIAGVVVLVLLRPEGTPEA